METAAEQAIQKSFDYSFLVGTLTFIIVALSIAIIFMWKYQTKAFKDVINEFKETTVDSNNRFVDALNQFTAVLHEIKGSVQRH